MLSIALALHCVALNVYHEARGEPFAGQVAVAQVTMRRARRDPERACEVVYARGQFSWTATAASMGKPDMLDPAWQRAQAAAALGLRWASGERMPDYSAGATHFHAVTVAPYWARRKSEVARIGGHVFRRAA